MEPSIWFGLQFAFTLLVCLVVAQWYVVPAVGRLPLETSMPPLMLIHATRVVGLVFLAPAVTDPLLPRSIAIPAAAGDCAAAVLALAAAFAFRYRWPLAVPLAWLTNVVGSADLVYVSAMGVALDFPTYKLGAAWFIPTTLGPIMITTHLLMFWLLLTRPAGGQGKLPPSAS